MTENFHVIFHEMKAKPNFRHMKEAADMTLTHTK